VETDPDLGRQLLQEAAELSPLNFHLESIRNHIADRIRQRTVDDGLIGIQRLRDKGQFREALKQVATLNKQLRPFQIPALEQMRFTLLEDLGIRPREAAVPPAVQTIAESEAAAPVYSRSLHVREAFRKTWQNIAASAGSMNIRKPLRETSERLAATLRQSQVWARERWSFTRGLFYRSPMAYPIAAGAACVVLVFATAMIGRSTESKPKLVHVGTGTLLLPVTLLQGPAANSGVAGALKAGQRVEILQPIPERSLDSWTLVRADGTPAILGYVRLQNLDQVQTEDRQLDLWVAMSFLDRSTSPNEFKKRLEDVDARLKEDPPAPSRDSDQIFLAASKAFARLAAGSATNSDEAEITRSALANSEAYLMRIEGALRFSDEADALQDSIRQTRAAIERPVAVAVKLPQRHAAPVRGVDEQARIMRLANNAYSQKIYETAASYCTQVLKINPENVAARNLLATVRREQDNLVASIIKQ
jgi:hypothetical protein